MKTRYYVRNAPPKIFAVMVILLGILTIVSLNEWMIGTDPHSSEAQMVVFHPSPSTEKIAARLRHEIEHINPSSSLTASSREQAIARQLELASNPQVLRHVLNEAFKAQKNPATPPRDRVDQIARELGVSRSRLIELHNQYNGTPKSALKIIQQLGISPQRARQLKQKYTN